MASPHPHAAGPDTGQVNGAGEIQVRGLSEAAASRGSWGWGVALCVCYMGLLTTGGSHRTNTGALAETVPAPLP